MSDKRHVDLEITYRDGRPRLGYLYLSDPGEKSEHSRRISPQIVVDINEHNELIGIELLDPENTTVDAINNVLEQYGMEPLKGSDLKPLLAA